MMEHKTEKRKTDGDPERRTLRHTVLLGVLLGIILLGPLAGAVLNTLIFLCSMIVVAALLDGGKRRTQAAMVIMALPAILLIAVQFLPRDSRWRTLLLDDWPAYVFQVLVIAALVYCGYLILVSLLNARSVSANEILGAISLYLVIAFIWSFSFEVLERARPGSFKLLDTVAQMNAPAQGSSPAQGDTATQEGTAALEIIPPGEDEVTSLQFIYFSLVTQCSLGYGDITPRSIMAQRLIILQAVMGQFYMAVVVAYLISLLMMKRRE